MEPLVTLICATQQKFQSFKGKIPPSEDFLVPAAAAAAAAAEEHFIVQSLSFAD
jgi:hypothetical protein